MFLDEPVVDEAAWAKVMKPGAAEVLGAAAAQLAHVEWMTGAIRAVIETAAGEQGLKVGKAHALVRVAVTGRTVGLPLFESLEALGRDRTLARIESATTKLG